MWVFMLFLAVPLIEIGLFVTVGGWLGLWPTLAVVLGTGMLGVYILRMQGLRAMLDMQSAMQTMQNPVSPMAHNAMIMLAGGLLILPGFLTDTLGLLLLITPLRQWVINRMAGRVGVFTAGGPAPDWRRGPQSRYDDEAIDAEYSEIDPERPPLPGKSRWNDE